jgi:hypothetical protein
MLVRSRSLSGHRSTLTSSVVAIFDLGTLSGYGYGPTLTSSIVACLLKGIEVILRVHGTALAKRADTADKSAFIATIFDCRFVEAMSF